MKDLTDTPRIPMHPRGFRFAATLPIVALVFALTLGAAASEAQARIAPSTTIQFLQHGNGSSARTKRSTYVAPRATTKANRRRHRRPAPELTPVPAPEPSPEASPTPSLTPTPTSAPESDPAPAPAPEPAPAPAPAPAPGPSGSVLFGGNFDNGFKGWYVQSLSTRATLVTNNVFQGSQAARFEVRDGDVEPDTGAERSEVAGPSFHEGQDLYIRDAIRVPSGNSYSAPWQIIEQLHEDDWGGSPGVALFLDNSQTLTLGAGDGSPIFWNGPSLQTGRWYELVYRVNLSQSSSTGFVEVWLDGVQQKLSNGQTRVYGQTIQTSETYIKAGIYRAKASTGTSIVEHDAITVGSSYAAATAS